jgi:hypothetical protein
MIYKVSVVVPEHRDLGGIQNMEKRPEPADKLQIGRETFEVVEVIELMPPRGEFSYLHVTCKLIEEKD